jgi:hypothetical protein
MSNGYMIIGVDPGLTTGLYVYRTYEANMTYIPDGPVQLESWQVASTLYEWLNRVLVHVEETDVHIAIEKYIITSRTAKLSQQSDALEITGAVKGIASLFPLVPEPRQYLKANLKFASDDMLRGVGWYSPKLRHANDAARQAFALLKDVDYPRWSELVRDAKMEPTTEG